MEGAANHRYWISRCVLFEIRHVSTEFSAARSGDICELSRRPGPSAQLLSQQCVGSVRGIGGPPTLSVAIVSPPSGPLFERQDFVRVDGLIADLPRVEVSLRTSQNQWAHMVPPFFFPATLIL